MWENKNRCFGKKGFQTDKTKQQHTDSSLSLPRWAQKGHRHMSYTSYALISDPSPNPNSRLIVSRMRIRTRPFFIGLNWEQWDWTTDELSMTARKKTLACCLDMKLIKLPEATYTWLGRHISSCVQVCWGISLRNKYY